MNYKVERSWLSQEYPCAVVMTDLGHRCGYVGVWEEHPLYGVEYNDETFKLRGFYDRVASGRPTTKDDIGVITFFLLSCGYGSVLKPQFLLNTHQGITYSRDGGGIFPIAFKDVWWFGYDCGHIGDGKDLRVLSPQLREMEERYPMGGTLRSEEYCFYHCVGLADQLREVEREYRFRKALLMKRFKKEGGQLK